MLIWFKNIWNNEIDNSYALLNAEYLMNWFYFHTTFIKELASHTYSFIVECLKSYEFVETVCGCVCPAPKAMVKLDRCMYNVHCNKKAWVIET